MDDALKKCSGCGCVTNGRCHVDVAGFTCGQPLCDDCTHVDQRYSWTHEPKNELVKRLRDGTVFVASEAAGVSGVISEFKTDALCYEAADMIEDLEAKLEEALEMVLDECGYLWRSESYNNWWQDRRNRVAQLKGAK